MIVVLVFVAPLYFIWTWNDALGQPFGDGPNYLMMAQHYSLNHERDQVYSEAATYSRFPPLYPLVLAASNAAGDLRCAHVVTTICLLLALLALYAWLRNERFPSEHSALLVLAFACLPGSWIIGLAIQTEYLYLLLSLAALGFMACYRSKARLDLLYGAALAVSAAMLTRTAGVSLLAPLLILSWRAPRGAGLLALTIALAPQLAWRLVHHQTLSYAGSFSWAYTNGWSSLRAQLDSELPALWNGFADNLTLSPTFRPLASVLALLCLTGAAWRAFKLNLDGIYIVVHISMILLWPYPEEARRFVWVLVPILLAQPLLCMVEWRTGPAGTSLLTTATVAALLTMSLPGLFWAADRYRAAAYSDMPDVRGYASWYATDPAGAERIARAEVGIVNAMQETGEYVPASDCIISIRPDLLNYYGHRRSEFPPQASMPDPYFIPGLQLTGCRYIFGMSVTDRRFPTPLYPLPRLGADVKVLYFSSMPDKNENSVDVVAALARL